MKFWVDIEFRHHDGSVHRKLSIKFSVFGQNVVDTNRISDKHCSICCDHNIGIVTRQPFGKDFLVEFVVYKRTQPRSRSEEHTSELQSRFDLVCRLLLEKKKDGVLRARTRELSGCLRRRDG